MSTSDDAAGVVAKELAKRSPKDRISFLRSLLAHTAAGLVVIEGSKVAAETAYRLADKIVDQDAAGRGYEP